jgi:hypothetical protein
MKKGEWIICVTDELFCFTKDKKYQLLKDVDDTINVLEIMNDKGWCQNPVFYVLRDRLDNYEYPERIFGDMTERVYYFKSVTELREEKINSILK